VREYSVTVLVLGRTGKINVTVSALSKIQACLDTGRLLADVYNVRPDDEVVVESCVCLLPYVAVAKEQC